MENILPTIRSRSQNIIFNNVSTSEIYEYLRSEGASQELSTELSDFSGGVPGIVLNYMKDVDTWNKQKEKLSKMLEIMDNSINERFSWVESNMKNSKDEENQYVYVEEILNNYMRLSRDLIVYHIDESIDLIHPFLLNSISKISKKYNQDKLVNFYNTATDSKKMIFKNVNPKIILENLLINL